MKRLLTMLFVALLGIVATAAPAVWFVNIYPGEDIYELEGHSAILIEDGYGSGAVVSYGQFDFASPGFVYRFVKGETDYCVGVFPRDRFVQAYRQAGRRMVAHRLAMDSVQIARLAELVAENLRPENRVYRYNYVKDNCATRPLRIVERAIGDTILLPPTEFDAESSRTVSFRNIMRHYHSNYPWYQFGIDLALGSGIDYRLNHREEAFAPVVLDSQLQGATVGGRPLVTDSEVIIDVPADNVVAAPTPWYIAPMFVCWLVFGLILLSCLSDLRRGEMRRWVMSLYFGILGLAGLLLSFLMFVSVHEATTPNWLYVWINPLCLVASIFIWLKSGKKVLMSYQIVNFVALLLLGIAWPWIPQSTNPAFLPLYLADIMLAVTYIKLNNK